MFPYREKSENVETDLSMIGFSVFFRDGITYYLALEFESVKMG